MLNAGASATWNSRPPACMMKLEGYFQPGQLPVRVETQHLLAIYIKVSGILSLRLSPYRRGVTGVPLT